MLKHIIFFKLIDYSDDEKSIVIEELSKRLKLLKEEIPFIQFLEVGININDRKGAFDVCLYTHFENLEFLNKYQVHPAHERLLEYLRTIRREVAVVDYEV